MPRIKCTVAYDGTAFHGYQVQPNKRTVQSVIEQALSRIHKGAAVKVVASGRTDAGVHAVGQVLHFDTNITIPIEKWPIVLNSQLTEEITIQHAEQVAEDFHARFSVRGKEYRYRIYFDKVRNPFLRNYAHFSPQSLNIDKMREAALLLEGEHDFTSFCSAKTEVVDKVREIYRVEILEEDKELTISFRGNGFLYNMVRIMVGTLLEVGTEKLLPKDIKTILESKNRSAAGKTAPAHGLYLWRVDY